MKSHAVTDYADAVMALLPPGAAWNWTKGGTGYALVSSSCAEFTRLEADIRAVLYSAIKTHAPKFQSWHISEYQRVAENAIAGVTELFPRHAATIGCHIGNRLWSGNAQNETFHVPLVTVNRLEGPAHIGRRIGDRLWGHYGRYVLVVRYYKSVVDPALLWDALMAFKQSHVFLWFEDITGVGGYL